jgi:hypothetical protein
MLNDEAKAAVLAAIRAGHSIRSIDQEELGLPDKRTIKLWLNTDLVFAAAFSAAEKERGTPKGLKALYQSRTGAKMTPAVCSRILNLVSEGKTLRQALLVDGMPCPRVVRDFRRINTEFERRLTEARSLVPSGSSGDLQSKSRISNAAKRYLAAFPEIIRRMEEGDGITALLAEKRFGQRSFAGFLKTHPEQCQQLIEVRRNQPRRAWRFAPAHYAQSLARLVIDVSTPVDEFKPENLPSYHAMRARCAHHPEFAEAFAVARRERIAKRCELASIPSKRKRAKRHNPAKPVYETAVLRGQLLQDELYRAANAAVGEWLQDRDDIITDLIEAALNGSIPIEEMKLHAGEFVTAHNRRIGFARALSLDAKVSDDSDSTFIESLTSDDYSFAD